MLEELIARILPPIISMCELMGIFVAAVSALRAFWNYCKAFVTHVPTDVKFELANGLGHQPGVQDGGGDFEDRAGPGT